MDSLIILAVTVLLVLCALCIALGFRLSRRHFEAYIKQCYIHKGELTHYCNWMTTAHPAYRDTAAYFNASEPQKLFEHVEMVKRKHQLPERPRPIEL